MAEATAPTAPTRAAGGVGVTIALCFLVSVLEGYDIQTVGVLGKTLQAALALTPEQFGLVGAIGNIGLVVGASFGGWLADKLGRKPVFITSVALFGIFTLGTGLAYDFYSLLIVRFLAGLGFGAAMPNMIAIAAEISRPDRRSSSATMMFCGMPLGGSIVAIFFANLHQNVDWRTIFVVGGVLPLVVAVLLAMFMRETRAASATDKAEKRGVLKALFGEGRAIPTLLLWITFLPTLLILYLMLIWLNSLVADKGFAKPLMFDIAGLAVGVNAAFVFNIVSVAGALIMGQLVDRLGFRWPAIIAYAGLIAAMLGLAAATDLPLIMFFSGLAGFCVLGAQYALYGTAASYYPAAVRGVGAGFTVALGRVGSVLGPILAGELLGSGASANQVIMYLAPIAGISGIAVLVLSFFEQHGKD